MVLIVPGKNAQNFQDSERDMEAQLLSWSLTCPEHFIVYRLPSGGPNGLLQIVLLKMNLLLSVICHQ